MNADGRKVATTPLMRSNFRLLYADIAWFGVLAGSAMSFFSVYAAEIGGQTLQLGLIAAGPAIINLLLSLPFGRWLEERSILRITLHSSIWHRLGYLFMIPLPLLLTPIDRVWLLILLILAMSIPGTMLAIAFNATFADLVPQAWRGQVVSRRNAILAIFLVGSSILSGQILKHVIFPLNYQIVFAIGAIGGGMSSYCLGRLREEQKESAPPPARQAINDPARPGTIRFLDAVRYPPGLRFLTRSAGKPLLRLDVLHTHYGLFLAAYLVFYIFQYLPIPLFPLYWVNELQLSPEVISFGNALFHGMTLTASLYVQRVSNRLGYRQLLLIGAFTYGFFPLLNAIAHDALLYQAANVVGGACWALLNVGLVNRLMEQVPENDRPAYMALHNVVLNMGIMAGSLLGSAMGNLIGLRSTLFLAAGLRLVSGILLGLWA